MKRLVLFSLLSMFLICSCATQKRQSTGAETEESYRKKPTLGERLRWIILGIFENEKEEQKKIPGTNTPDPRFPE